MLRLGELSIQSQMLQDWQIAPHQRLHKFQEKLLLQKHPQRIVFFTHPDEGDYVNCYSFFYIKTLLDFFVTQTYLKTTKIDLWVMGGLKPPNKKAFAFHRLSVRMRVFFWLHLRLLG